jgi:D-alanyl-D-alanine carboxypeptidase
MMMSSISRRGLMQLALCLSIGLQPAHANPARDRQQAALEVAAAQVVREQGLPGLAVAVVRRDGSVVAAAAGFADRETRRRMTPQTLSLGASTGKTYVGALAVVLAGEGKLDLDAPIAGWLDDRPWFSRLPNASTITMRSLLDHTSGLADHVFLEGFGKAFVERNARDPDRAFTPEELVQFVLDRPPLGPVGSKFAYSDTNFILAGLVLERAGKAPFYRQVAARFLAPLRLQQTRPSDTRWLPGLAAGYMKPNNAFGLPAKSLQAGRLVFNPRSEWTGGGFATTAPDLARWAFALFAGAALTPAERATLLQPGPVPVEAGESRYALGVGLRPDGGGYGHSGGMPYYSAQMGYLPKRQLAFAIIVNTDDFDRAAAEKLLLDAVSP